MKLLKPGFQGELQATLQLAGPVILAELGWMSMGIVDTIFVGRLGAEAIGAVSLGSAVYFAIAIFGMGLLLGLDPLISQAFGAGQRHECRSWLVQGIYLSLALSPWVMFAIAGGMSWLRWLGVHASVLTETVPFLHALSWGTVPLFFYAAFRRYLQAIGLVKPVTFALVSANILNIIGDWILVYGHWGFPAMGVVGSGWVTTIARLYLAAVLLGTVLVHEARHGDRRSLLPWWPSFGRIWRLLTLGFPAAVHVTLEVGVFAVATTLAGLLDPVALAAHHIALDVASITFMIPLGLASAGAVRVGQALGRGEPSAAGRAGWMALTLGTSFMIAAGLVMAIIPQRLASIFTTDTAVVAMAGTLMLVAAAFQLFDGLQGVSTGTLRGAGDTQTPMFCTLVAHWVIGLPLGYLLAFPAGYGVVGLWVGLAFGLATAGITLVRAWSRKAKALAQGELRLATTGE
jgi:MATE family multidrug resistance protein